jgi:hypothetical protein
VHAVVVLGRQIPHDIRAVAVGIGVLAAAQERIEAVLDTFGLDQRATAQRTERRQNTIDRRRHHVRARIDRPRSQLEPAGEELLEGRELPDLALGLAGIDAIGLAERADRRQEHRLGSLDPHEPTHRLRHARVGEKGHPGGRLRLQGHGTPNESGLVVQLRNPIRVSARLNG